jgi:hypothetical protein
MTAPSPRWLWAIYGSVLVPYVGPAVLILTSSVLYYGWRKTDPDRAKWINRHAWIAVFANAAAVFALRHALGR